MTFVPGENVGPYRIIEQLGQGGMATVYKAYHAALDRHVAIKALHPAFKGDPNFMARFNREAKIVAKLNHPHIVPVYDFSEHEGTPYLVMRYIEGRTLKVILGEEGACPLDKVMEIMVPVGEALTYAHSQGVLHRDIKPSNIMLTAAGEVFLTDFGLARMAQAAETTLSRDMMIGTPQYISPEQAKGEVPDHRTDIYSLGVVLFEMLTGRVPYSADTPYAVIHNHIYSPLPLPSKIKPDIPSRIEQVVLKALAKRKEDRYDSISTMINALTEASREAVEAPPPEVVEKPVPPEPVGLPEEVSPPPQPGRRFPRRRLFAAGGVLLFLCVCCFLALAIVNEQQKKAAKLEPTPTPVPTTLISRRPGGEKPTMTPPSGQISSARKEAIAHLTRAEEYARQGDIVKAVEEYHQAIAADPSFVEAYLKAGSFFMKQDRPEEAIEAFKQALEIDPDNVIALQGIANVLFFQEEYADAAEFYQRVIELRPELPLPHARLGRYYLLLGQLDDAKVELEKAIELDPKLPEAHFGLGLLYKVLGQEEEAKGEFQTVLELEEASAALKRRAQKELDQLP
ncbi:MAG: protein kinase [Anaerolineae bacterium]